MASGREHGSRSPIDRVVLMLGRFIANAGDRGGCPRRPPQPRPRRAVGTIAALANSHRDPAFPRFQGREAELLVDAVAVGAGLQPRPSALPGSRPSRTARPVIAVPYPRRRCAGNVATLKIPTWFSRQTPTPVTTGSPATFPPPGPLFCMIDGPTRGRAWSATAVGAELRHLAAQAGVRRRFAPRQLRHARAVELLHEGSRY
jgi:hypothetical protein